MPATSTKETNDERNRETIADIVAQLRAVANIQTADTPRSILEFADRIEAAAKREIPQPDPDWKTICEKCKDGEILPDNCEYFGEPNGCNSPLYGQHPKEEHGNAAAMRAALERVIEIAKREWDAFRETAAMKEMHDICEAALASPPRNCDVGTAEEQFERWQSFCDKFDDDCKGCPCDGHSSSLTYCFSKWAQLPYEEGDKDGE